MEWTGWAYGHLRKTNVDILQKHVSKERLATEIQAAKGVKSVVAVKIARAIYGMGWDGTVVLEGNWKHEPDAVVPNCRIWRGRGQP